MKNRNIGIRRVYFERRRRRRDNQSETKNTYKQQRNNNHMAPIPPDEKGKQELIMKDSMQDEIDRMTLQAVIDRPHSTDEILKARIALIVADDPELLEIKEDADRRKVLIKYGFASTIGSVLLGAITVIAGASIVAGMSLIGLGAAIAGATYKAATGGNIQDEGSIAKAAKLFTGKLTSEKKTEKEEKGLDDDSLYKIYHIYSQLLIVSAYVATLCLIAMPFAAGIIVEMYDHNNLNALNSVYKVVVAVISILAAFLGGYLFVGIIERQRRIKNIWANKANPADHFSR
ncbi:MAG: hypothetical protein [Olavius algarvensis Gamma 1 endosymbiont]|nr:MAG: hypothetical protein [Olavius algarvensis Gamma 1 endosymbiont]